MILLLCLSLYHTRMLIQRLQKWWIETPSLLTCVKTIQNSARVRSVWIFQSTIFEVIGLPQSHIMIGKPKKGIENVLQKYISDMFMT